MCGQCQIKADKYLGSNMLNTWRRIQLSKLFKRIYSLTIVKIQFFSLFFVPLNFLKTYLLNKFWTTSLTHQNTQLRLLPEVCFTGKLPRYCICLKQKTLKNF